MPLPNHMAIPGFINDVTRQAAARGWSLEDLEQRAGLPAGYLAAVEALRRPPTKTACERLAAALQIDPMRLSPWLGPQTLTMEKPAIVAELREAIMFLELLPDDRRARAITAIQTIARTICRQAGEVIAYEARIDDQA